MKIILLSFCILLFKLSFGQSSSFKLFLIGDTGDDKTLEFTMSAFLDNISMYPNSATVFLGDNCYKWPKKGFDGSKITRKRLGTQLDGLNSRKIEGSVYFVPGNHDWWNVTRVHRKGERHLKIEESYIETELSKHQFIRNKDKPFMPMDGNPIDSVSLNDSQLKLIFLDTHWLIIQESEKEKAEAYSLLDTILSNAISRNQKIVVVAHHPIYTHGRHSKKRRWQFPKALKDQDIYHPLYKEMRIRVECIFSRQNYPIIYASGHDHALEYFQKDSVQYIVSGAGSKSSKRFNKKTNQDFNPSPQDGLVNQIAYVHEGYFEVEYAANNVSITAVLREWDNPLNKQRNLLDKLRKQPITE